MDRNEQEPVLRTRFVESDYFLVRIRTLEQKYEMEWGEFLGKYNTGKLEEGYRSNSDYIEWAFLCNNFMSELVREEYTGPPGNSGNSCLEEPEISSGSSFLGDIFVRTEPLFLKRRARARHFASALYN